MVPHYCSQLHKCQRKSAVCSACMSAGSADMWKRQRGWSRRCSSLLHQLCLVYVCNPALQPLRMFREELEFGAVTFRMLPGVVITDLSWRTDQKIKVIHKHSEQTEVKSGVYYAAVSTVVLLPVETGWTCPGLFVFLHATLHSLGWPWCWFFSARRSWPGSPSLIHQPLLQRTCLSSSTVLSLTLAVPPHLMCACVCLCLFSLSPNSAHFLLKNLRAWPAVFVRPVK